MKTKKINGIIFSKNLYAENDEMLNVLTSEKILNIYAKGVRKIESKNRTNVLLGAIVNFEIFDDYATENSFLLKKATAIKTLPIVNKQNNNKIISILQMLKKFRNFNSEIYETYLLLLENFENENFFKIQTFLMLKILESQGEGLIFSHCVLCSTNQNLFSIDIYKGGILCKQHSKEETKLKLLKSFYFLGQSIDKYITFVSPENNRKILNTLSLLVF